MYESCHTHTHKGKLELSNEAMQALRQELIPHVTHICMNDSCHTHTHTVDLKQANEALQCSYESCRTRVNESCHTHIHIGELERAYEAAQALRQELVSHVTHKYIYESCHT